MRPSCLVAGRFELSPLTPLACASPPNSLIHLARSVAAFGRRQGSCIAMVGKGCVAIACDLRLGNQALTVACNFEKVRPPVSATPRLPLWHHGNVLFEVKEKLTTQTPLQVFSATERTYYGLPGLASDTITVRDKLRHRINLYAMKEERTIEPETFCHLVSSTLYERRCVLGAFCASLGFWRPMRVVEECGPANMS